MRFIEKSKEEPPELLRYRKSAGGSAYWDGFPDKTAVRDRLIRDQGALCCYCMRRITESKMKVEHYRSRKEHPEEQLSWKNLLAACTGGEGEAVQTCDTSRGDRSLVIDPRIRKHILSLHYLADGAIKSRGDPHFEGDINDTLNLNAPRLKQLRAERLKGFKDAMERRLGKGRRWSNQKLQGEIERIRSQQKLPEFSGMFEWWLEKRLKRFS